MLKSSCCLTPTFDIQLHFLFQLQLLWFPTQFGSCPEFWKKWAIKSFNTLHLPVASSVKAMKTRLQPENICQITNMSIQESSAPIIIGEIIDKKYF